MIILTAFAIGLLSASMRSVVCYVLAGGLIVAAFSLSAVVSAGPVSMPALAGTLLSYNAGIAASVFTALALTPRHH